MAFLRQIGWSFSSENLEPRRKVDEGGAWGQWRGNVSQDSTEKAKHPDLSSCSPSMAELMP